MITPELIEAASKFLNSRGFAVAVFAVLLAGTLYAVHNLLVPVVGSVPEMNEKMDRVIGLLEDWAQCQKIASNPGGKKL